MTDHKMLVVGRNLGKSTTSAQKFFKHICDYIDMRKYEMRIAKSRRAFPKSKKRF